MLSVQAFAALLMLLAGGVGFDDSPATKNPVVEPKQLVEDFHVLRTALEEGHSGVYRYTAKADLDRIFDEAEKSLNRPMDVLEFYRLVAPVVAAVKCGHTGIRLPSRLRAGPGYPKPVLPLYVRILDGKVYVFRDFSSDKGELVGKEIRSINGVPASAIVDTMVKATSGDGDVATSRIYRLRDLTFCFQLINLLGLNPPYTVEFWDPQQKQAVTQKIDGVQSSKLTEASRTKFPQDQRPPTAGSFRFLDGDRIGVLKINGFGGFVDKEHKKDLKALYKESFTAMHEKGVKTLIIDLRNNGGGADELGKLLLSYLVDQPFQYYDDLVINKLQFSFAKYCNPKMSVPEKLVERQTNGKYRAVKHPNWGTQQPSTPTFSGKVFILINGGSFSTTSEFLSHVHYRKRATFLGEESAGGYYGNTSGPSTMVTLPNTKLELGLPLMTYYMSVKGSPANHGVVPDYPVTYTIQELLDSKDKEMALAVELAGKD